MYSVGLYLQTSGKAFRITALCGLAREALTGRQAVRAQALPVVAQTQGRAHGSKHSPN